MFFFLMIRRPPRSTQSRSSAASDVYKRQIQNHQTVGRGVVQDVGSLVHLHKERAQPLGDVIPVSYTHLRAHETVLDLVCRLLLEKKKIKY